MLTELWFHIIHLFFFFGTLLLPVAVVVIVTQHTHSLSQLVRATFSLSMPLSLPFLCIYTCVLCAVRVFCMIFTHLLKIQNKLSCNDTIHMHILEAVLINVIVLRYLSKMAQFASWHPYFYVVCMSGHHSCYVALCHWLSNLQQILYCCVHCSLISWSLHFASIFGI